MAAELITSTVAGPTSGVQVTTLSGGTAVSWWTKPLEAITIPAGSVVAVQLSGKESNAFANVQWRVRVEKTDGSGDSPVVIASGQHRRELATTETVYLFYLVSSSEVSLSDGDRVHVMVYGDDSPDGNMAASYTFSLFVDHDDLQSWVGFEEALREYIERTFTLDAEIVTAGATTVPGDFTANATIFGTRAGTFTAEATLRKTLIWTFPLDAELSGTTTVPGSFLVDATLKRLQTGGFPLDAELSGTVTVPGSFNLDAMLLGVGIGSFPVDAVLLGAVIGSFPVEAALLGTELATFPLDAEWDYLHQGGSFAVAYMWRLPSQPLPLLGVPTRILVNGVDIADHVQWSTASFTAKVNQASGDCSFEVIDRAHDMSFSFGDEVRLYIDGVLRWGGWIFRAVRTFPFQVMPSPATEPRVWQIEGVDFGRVLDRRVLHDLSNPDRSWNYPAGTYDDEVINDIWTDFDMAGFSKDIRRVGPAVLDIPGVTAKTGGSVASGGFTLRDVLLHVSWDTAAIFYVTPNKVVTYLDSETVTSPYTLTDTPSGPYDAGYREVRILEDSTEMVNDSMVWGAGKGSSNIVFSRYPSGTIQSQTDHGLWQAGNFTSGIYKQATANAVARARVEGSPAAKRGAKNPKRSVELVTWQTVFGVGDVVAIENNQFGYSDVLPIRSMTVTWPTPFYPRFALQMSWEIDAVWSFFDPWLNPGNKDTGKTSIGEEGTSSQCDCGVTDTFTRTRSSGWGTADCGLSWEETGTDTYASSVDSGTGWLTASDRGDVMEQLVGGTWPDGFLMEARFSLSDGLDWLGTDLFFGTNGSPNIDLYRGGGGLMVVSGTNDSDSADVTLLDGLTYRLKWDFHSVDDHCRAKIWVDGNAEPGWMVDFADGTPDQTTFFLVHLYSTSISYPTTLSLDSLDISDIDRCTQSHWDTFSRTVASGWGTGDAGQGWTGSQNGSGGSASVNGSQGVMVSDGLEGNLWQQQLVSGDGPWTSGEFTMTMLFSISDNYGGDVWESDTFIAIQAGTHIPQVNITTFGLNTGIAVNGYVGSDSSLFALTKGVQYYLKWDYHSSDTHCRAKIWQAGSAEPGTWLIDFDDTTIGAAVTSFWIRNWSNLTYASTLTVDYIDFDYTGRPCYWEVGVPVDPPPGGGTTSGMRLVDHLVPMDYASLGYYPSGSHWTTIGYAILPGTALLAVNSIYQFGNWVITEPENGIIRIDTTVAEDAWVSLDYITNGPAGGTSH